MEFLLLSIKDKWRLNKSLLKLLGIQFIILICNLELKSLMRNMTRQSSIWISRRARITAIKTQKPLRRWLFNRKGIKLQKLCPPPKVSLNCWKRKRREPISVSLANVQQQRLMQIKICKMKKLLILISLRSLMRIIRELKSMTWESLTLKVQERMKWKKWARIGCWSIRAKKSRNHCMIGIFYRSYRMG